MKYSQRPLKGWNWLVGLYNLTFFSNKGLFVYLSILSLTTVKMPPKNKVNVSVIQVTAGSCENGISDSIPILIQGNHRFQNFWKGTHMKIESE